MKKIKTIKVLSLFDGISCGRVALERADFKIEKYYASEVDKYAIQIAQKNYPDTIQVGCITQLKGEDYDVDLIIGGSPCQGFSLAGKQLNFNDSKSVLFFEFVRILKEIQPKYFLLENVKMKQEWQDIISEYIGVKPIEINSSLLSGQNRKRLYWTNIPNIKQPENKGLVLTDILQSSVDEKYYMNNISLKRAKKNCERKTFKTGNKRGPMPLVRNEINKALCLTTACGSASNRTSNRVSVKNNLVRKLTEIECERLQTLPDNYTEGISMSQRYKTIGNGWTVDVIAHIFKNIKI